MTLENDKNNMPPADQNNEGGFVDFETDSLSDNASDDFSAYMPTPERFQEEQQALKDAHKAKDYEELLPKNDSLDKILKSPDEKPQKKPPEEKELIKEEIQEPEPVEDPVDNSQYMQDQPEIEIPEEFTTIENAQPFSEEIIDSQEQASQKPEEEKPEQDQNQEVEYSELLPASDSESITIIDFEPDETCEKVAQEAQEEKKITEPDQPEKESEKKSSPPPDLPAHKDEVIIDDFGDKDIQTFCGVCHLSNVVLLTAFWGPFLMYLSRRENAHVRFHAIQSILYGFFFLLIGVIAVLISAVMITGCACLLIILLPLLLVILGTLWGYAIFVVIQIYKGIDYKIPYICDITDKIISKLEYM